MQKCCQEYQKTAQMKTLEVVTAENCFEVALVLHDVLSNSRVYVYTGTGVHWVAGKPHTNICLSFSSHIY